MAWVTKLGTIPKYCPLRCLSQRTGAWLFRWVFAEALLPWFSNALDPMLSSQRRFGNILSSKVSKMPDLEFFDWCTFCRNSIEELHFRRCTCLYILFCLRTEGHLAFLDILQDRLGILSKVSTAKPFFIFNTYSTHSPLVGQLRQQTGNSLHASARAWCKRCTFLPAG